MARSVKEQVGVDEPEGLEPLVKPQAVEEPDRPEWLPDQFNDPAELAKAWDEARRETNRVQTQLSEMQDTVQVLIERAEELERGQQMQPAQQFDASQDPTLMMLAQAYEVGDYTQAALLQAKIAADVANAATQQALASQQAQPNPQNQMLAILVDQQLGQRFGEQWTPEFKNEVGEYIGSRPHQFAWIEQATDPSATADALADVADLILSRKAREAGVSSQQQAAQDSRQQKLAAQTLQGAGARTAGATDPKEELLARMAQVRQYGYGA